MLKYTHKVVYLGIDVHKKTYAVTAICEGQVVKKDTLKADGSFLLSYCKKYFPEAQIQTMADVGCENMEKIQWIFEMRSR